MNPDIRYYNEMVLAEIQKYGKWTQKAHATITTINEKERDLRKAEKAAREAREYIVDLCNLLHVELTEMQRAGETDTPVCGFWRKIGVPHYTKEA